MGGILVMRFLGTHCGVRPGEWIERSLHYAHEASQPRRASGRRGGIVECVHLPHRELAAPAARADSDDCAAVFMI